MFYDTGQGQGWQRNIVMNGSPHLPSSIRQWWGDSRSRWEGNTLVVDVTNFSPKTDAYGSRENLHLVERWTRTSSTTLEYSVTIDDPTLMLGARMEELAFSEGRGPDPATKDNATGFRGRRRQPAQLTTQRPTHSRMSVPAEASFWRR
jgi:hypothetical protein